MVDVGVERRGAEGGEEPAGVPDGGEPVLFCMGFGSPCRLGVRVGEYEQGWRHTKDAMTDLKMEGGEAEENGAMVRRGRLEEGDEALVALRILVRVLKQEQQLLLRR